MTPLLPPDNQQIISHGGLRSTNERQRDPIKDRMSLNVKLKLESLRIFENRCKLQMLFQTFVRNQMFIYPHSGCKQLRKPLYMNVKNRNVKGQFKTVCFKVSPKLRCKEHMKI